MIQPSKAYYRQGMNRAESQVIILMNKLKRREKEIGVHVYEIKRLSMLLRLHGEQLELGIETKG